MHNTNYPGYQYGYQPQYPPPRKPRKKVLPVVIPLVVIVLAVVGGGVWWVISDRADAASSAKSGTASPQVGRPGYEKIGSVSDPFALVEKPNPTPAMYHGTPVVQACNVVTMNELRAAGVLPLSFTGTNVSLKRLVVGDDRPAAQQGELRMQHLTSFDFQGANHCEYAVERAPGSTEAEIIRLDLFQPAYAEASAVSPERLADDYTLKTTSPRGIDVFTFNRVKAHSAADNPDYLLRSGANFLHIDAHLDTGKHTPLATAFDGLVQKMIDNFATQLASPTGPAIYTYDSTAFRQPIVRGCDILKPEDVQALLSTPAAPLVEDGPATAIGRISVDSNLEGNFTKSECLRGTGESARESRSGLRVEAETYDSAELARGVFDYDRDFYQGVPLPTPIGDAHYVDMHGDPITPPGKLVVLYKNVIVSLVPILATQPKGISLQTVDQSLRPMVQTMLSRIPAH